MESLSSWRNCSWEKGWGGLLFLVKIFFFIYTLVAALRVCRDIWGDWTEFEGCSSTYLQLSSKTKRQRAFPDSPDCLSLGDSQDPQRKRGGQKWLGLSLLSAEWGLEQFTLKFLYYLFIVYLTVCYTPWSRRELDTTAHTQLLYNVLLVSTVQ